MNRYMDFKGMEAVQNNFLISIAPFIFVSPLSRNKHRISFQALFPLQYIHRFSRVVFYDGWFFFPFCASRRVFLMPLMMPTLPQFVLLFSFRLEAPHEGKSP